jgi:glycosyltransferase involved in cell wall biosynthesis
MRKKFRLNKKKCLTFLNYTNFKELAVDEFRKNEIIKKYSINDFDNIIVSMAVLNEQKGIKYLIEAIGELAKNYNIAFVMLGRLTDENYKNEVFKIIKEYNIEDRVFFPGFVSNVADWLSIASIYVQPSIEDNTPNSIMKAMYFKLPVIVTDLATNYDIVKDGKTGYIAKIKSPSSLKKCLKKIIDNPDVAKKIGENSRDFVVKECSLEDFVSKLENLF